MRWAGKTSVSEYQKTLRIERRSAVVGEQAGSAGVGKRTALPLSGLKNSRASKMPASISKFQDSTLGEPLDHHDGHLEQLRHHEVHVLRAR